MEITDLNRMASSLAKKYARKCWWASLDDLRQEALSVMLSSYRTYLKHPEGDPCGYVYRAAACGLRNYLLRNNTPVSASSYDLDSLRGIVRVDGLAKEIILGQRAKPEARVEMKLRAVQTAEYQTDENFEDTDWLDRARARLTEVLNKVPNYMIATQVLLAKRRPKEVAVENGVDVRVVYKATKAARRAIVNDPVLYDLTSEVVGRKNT
jgi:hypothetical protein